MCKRSTIIARIRLWTLPSEYMTHCRTTSRSRRYSVATRDKHCTEAISTCCGSSRLYVSSCTVGDNSYSEHVQCTFILKYLFIGRKITAECKKGTCDYFVFSQSTVCWKYNDWMTYIWFWFKLMLFTKVEIMKIVYLDSREWIRRMHLKFYRIVACFVWMKVAL